MLNLNRGVLLSTCLTILFVVPCAYTQEIQTVLKPNQLLTFSLAPEQEKLCVLNMKKGGFADVQSLAREGLNLSLEIYDLERKELLEKSGEFDGSIWFVAPTDGDFILVTKLGKYQYPEIVDAQKISIQYNNKLKLPPGTKLKGIRKVNGFDVKIMTTPKSSEGGDGDSVLLIERNGQLQKAMKKRGDGVHTGFSFDDGIYVYSKDDIYIHSAGSIKTKSGLHLIKTTPDVIKFKTKSTGRRDVYFSDELPNVVIGYSSGGRAGGCTFFVELGDPVKVKEPDSIYFVGIGKNPKGGLFFEALDSPLGSWFTSGCMACFRPAPTTMIWGFKNGVLRPNIDLMKKPAPSLAVLRSKAQKFGHQVSLKPYKGAKDLNALQHDLVDGKPLEDPGLFIKEDLGDEPPFWDVMIDLIYTGNEDLAWLFLDLIWPPQKQGKASFIRDFKNELSKSRYWQTILEDKKR